MTNYRLNNQEAIRELTIYELVVMYNRRQGSTWFCKTQAAREYISCTFYRGDLRWH